MGSDLAESQHDTPAICNQFHDVERLAVGAINPPHPMGDQRLPTGEDGCLVLDADWPVMHAGETQNAALSLAPSQGRDGGAVCPSKGLEINGLKIPPAHFTPNLHLGRLNSHEHTPFRSRFSQEV